MRRSMLYLAAVLITGTAGLARNIAWNPKVQPRLPLEQALAKAEKTLDAERKGFYCIGASLATTTSRDGDWTFTFASKDGTERWVKVDLDGGISVHRVLAEF